MRRREIIRSGAALVAAGCAALPAALRAQIGGLAAGPVEPTAEGLKAAPGEMVLSELAKVRLGGGRVERVELIGAADLAFRPEQGALSIILPENIASHMAPVLRLSGNIRLT